MECENSEWRHKRKDAKLEILVAAGVRGIVSGNQKITHVMEEKASNEQVQDILQHNDPFINYRIIIPALFPF
jgi:hypothetical protein